MKDALKQLPRWFRHLLGFATFLLISGLGSVSMGYRNHPMLALFVLAAGTVFGLLAWVYIAKAGDFSKKEPKPYKRWLGSKDD